MIEIVLIVVAVAATVAAYKAGQARAAATAPNAPSAPASPQGALVRARGRLATREHAAVTAARTYLHELGVPAERTQRTRVDDADSLVFVTFPDVTLVPAHGRWPAELVKLAYSPWFGQLHDRLSPAEEVAVLEQLVGEPTPA